MCCSLVLHTESVKRAREMYYMFTWCLQRVYTVFAACFYHIYFAFHSNFSGSCPCRNILQHTATHCTLLQHAAFNVSTVCRKFSGNTLHTLHTLHTLLTTCLMCAASSPGAVHSTTHCNTLQHTAAPTSYNVSPMCSKFSGNRRCCVLTSVSISTKRISTLVMFVLQYVAVCYNISEHLDKQNQYNDYLIIVCLDSICACVCVCVCLDLNTCSLFLPLFSRI